MYESRIAADPLTVAAVEGFPPDIDVLAARNLPGHGFLRAAWYRGDRPLTGPQAGRTLVLRRGDGSGPAITAIPTAAIPLAAIPIVPFGPAIFRARKVAGSYWPHRSALIAPDCGVRELAQALTHPAAKCLGPVWRIGPARSDDPTTHTMIEGARLAGWAVLSRPAGTSWVVDLNEARTKGFPRGSVPRKLRAGWRRLEALGTPRWRNVQGDQWSADVLADLGKVEQSSWIARTTDGSGAKFLTPDQRAAWHAALTDPELARRLSATILMLDDRPVAFSFDLDDGPIRYGIAGSHAEDLKHCYIGKNINYRAMSDAIAAGQLLFDLGSGDSGYKREMGALAAYDFVDLLFVRSAAVARVLARFWGDPIAPLAKTPARA